jgi:hypothetical protein
VPTTHWAAGGQTVSVHDGPVLGPFSGDGARIGQVALNRWSDPGDQILDVSGGGWLDFQLVACERQSYEMTGHQLHSQFGVGYPEFRSDLLSNRAMRDLLDANEWTWAFAGADRVGRVEKPQARGLGTVGS